MAEALGFGKGGFQPCLLRFLSITTGPVLNHLPSLRPKFKFLRSVVDSTQTWGTPDQLPLFTPSTLHSPSWI